MNWKERFFTVLTFPVWGSICVVLLTLFNLVLLGVIIITPLYVLLSPDSGFKASREIKDSLK